MPFKAQLPSGEVRHIRECVRADGPFVCRNGCGPMSFVQGAVRRTAHFRHHVTCQCSWEPETADHESAKEAVCAAINRLGLGMADVEVPVGKFTADVLWTSQGQRIAFEVQRANYPWAKFREKIEGYAAEGVATVYLFIGPEFYLGGKKEEFRLKEVEHSFTVGAVEFCEERHPNSTVRYLPEIVRLRRRLPPRTTAAYLRRQKGTRDALLVREPLFYPTFTKDNFPKQSHVWEVGAAVSPLAEYLRSVGHAFFAPQHVPFLWGHRFGSLCDAKWAYFFSRVGLAWDYDCHADDEPGYFSLKSPHGRTSLLASRGAGPAQDLPRNDSFLQLNDAPLLAHGFCCVGGLGDSHSWDTAILAVYERVLPRAIDFSQLNNDYSGVMTGRHDGGSAGGRGGEDFAEEALELWRDGEALLESGHSYPLRYPLFDWPVRPGPVNWPVVQS